MKNKPCLTTIILQISVTLVLLTTVLPATAGSELLGLLSVLKENGTINEAQYVKLIKEAQKGVQVNTPKAENIANNVIPDKSNGTEEKATTAKAKFGKNGGLKLTSNDGQFEFQVGGRLFLDASRYSEDKSTFGNGAEVRSARVSFKGRLFDDWLYKAQYDFAENEAEVKDIYLSYCGFDVFNNGLTIGNFKEPFSLEEQTSGKNITFLERAQVIDAFSPGRAIGIGAGQYGDNWSFAGGGFFESVGDVPDDEGNEGWGAAARLTYAPIHSKKRLVHLGVSTEYREPDDEGTVRYDPTPESHLTSNNLIDTGKIKNVNYTNLLGLEAALVTGPFSLQGEFINSRVVRDDDLEDLNFSGWYLSSSFFLTGEVRSYDNQEGSFGSIKPKNSYGAWELALRYSSLDLNDNDIDGGSEDDITLGLNWYVNPRIRFMANYIWVDSEKDGLRDQPNISQIRSQLSF